jgi:hypothetical protein
MSEPSGYECDRVFVGMTETLKFTPTPSHQTGWLKIKIDLDPRKKSSELGLGLDMPVASSL